MAFIESIETFRKVISLYNFSSKFIFAAEDVVMQIGSNELNAAKQSLCDMHSSNSPRRELNMTITHLSSALHHFDSKRYSCFGFFDDWTAMEKCYQTSLFISICYFSIEEHLLCEQYRNLSCDYFAEWLDHYHRPQGKMYAQHMRYDLVKNKVNEIGLSWPYTYPDTSWNPFSLKDQRDFDEAYEKHKKEVKKQYKALTFGLTKK